MTPPSPEGFAPFWTEGERDAWIAAYLADEPVQRPLPEHDEGECDHCDLLRELTREAERRSV